MKELVASIRTWITNWNDDPKPFVWHKTADEILTNLAGYLQRINESGHKATDINRAKFMATSVQSRGHHRAVS